MNYGSSQLVYSLVFNINNIVKKNYFDNDINLFQNFYFNGNENITTTPMWKKCRESVVTKCNKIYRDIENRFYDYKDVVMFGFHNQLLKKSFCVFDINRESVNEVKKIYTKNQLEKDKEKLIIISKKTNVKGIEEFVKIREDGSSILKELIDRKYISPMFFLYLKEKKVLTNEIEHDIFICDDYKRFANIANIIYKLYKQEGVI